MELLFQSMRVCKVVLLLHSLTSILCPSSHLSSEFLPLILRFLTLHIPGYFQALLDNSASPCYSAFNKSETLIAMQSRKRKVQDFLYFKLIQYMKKMQQQESCTINFLILLYLKKSRKPFIIIYFGKDLVNMKHNLQA